MTHVFSYIIHLTYIIYSFIYHISYIMNSIVFLTETSAIRGTVSALRVLRSENLQ